MLVVSDKHGYFGAQIIQMKFIYTPVLPHSCQAMSSYFILQNLLGRSFICAI